MEQLLGWVQQWHQQMPGWRKEGESGDEGSDLGTTQEMKEAGAAAELGSLSWCLHQTRSCDDPPA